MKVPSPNHLVKQLLILTISTCFLVSGEAQHYDNAHIFAHNDYESQRPFHTAYDLQVGFIEADIFLVDGKILVAHHKHEIEAHKTLEELYLKPLKAKINQNHGFVYDDHQSPLTLMVDLKTEGPRTLKALIAQLENYPELISSQTLQIMISGNVPNPAEWNEYPTYIYFDGRPGINYTPGQLERIPMISTNFNSHAKWDGKTKISDADRKKIDALVDEVHAKGKKMRFWATPDFEEAWKELIELRMDVIVTDSVEQLASFLSQQK